MSLSPDVLAERSGLSLDVVEALSEKVFAAFSSSLMDINAADVLDKEEKEINSFPPLVAPPPLDALLPSGRLPLSQLVELVGSSCSGKTQVCPLFDLLLSLPLISSFPSL